MPWLLMLLLPLLLLLEEGNVNVQHDGLIALEDRSIKFDPGRIRIAPDLDTILNAKLILFVKNMLGVR
jgi:hypothetical protein